MPMYTYQFEDGTTIEKVQSMADSALKRIKHPETGEWGKVKRVYSAPFVHGINTPSGIRVDPTKSLEWNKAQIP